MEGQYTHYIIMPNTVTALEKQITTRYDWQTFTYKEVDKVGIKTQDVTLPTDDNTKAEIKTFMDEHSIEYGSSDTKSELLTKIEEYCINNNTPTEKVEYTYKSEEIDKTTDHSAKVSDLIKRHPNFFAPRISSDKTEMVIKSDFTLAELKAIEGLSGFSVYTNEEIKNYIATSDKWKDGE